MVRRRLAGRRARRGRSEADSLSTTRKAMILPAQLGGSRIRVDELHADVEPRNSIYGSAIGRAHDPATSGASAAQSRQQRHNRRAGSGRCVKSNIAAPTCDRWSRSATDTSASRSDCRLPQENEFRFPECSAKRRRSCQDAIAGDKGRRSRQCRGWRTKPRHDVQRMITTASRRRREPGQTAGRGRSCRRSWCSPA